MENFLVQRWPNVIVELGTGTGSFSVYLASYALFHGFRFHTFDTHRGRSAPQQFACLQCLDAVRRLGGVVHCSDVFSSETINEIFEILSFDGDAPSFLYCDDGDKLREIETYCDALSKGDYLGFHDYETDVRDEDLGSVLGDFVFWQEELFKDCGSNNRILERVN